LKEQLARATRTESKKINDRIQDLQAEKNKVLKEIEKMDD
jgi:hypothetical protein